MASQKQSRAKSGQASDGAGTNSGRTSSSKRGAASKRGTASGRTGASNSGDSISAGRAAQPGRNAARPSQPKPRAAGPAQPKQRAAGPAQPKPRAAGPAQPKPRAAGPAQPKPRAAKGTPGPAVQERQPGQAAAAQPGAPRWLQLTTLILSVAGLGVSIYLTIAHYNTGLTLACPDTGVVNCLKVTTSAESKVFGIPVAVLGLAFFLFMVAANSPWAWRAKLPSIYWARLGSVVVGMIFVLYLVYSEIITIGNICLWCTSVHVITFLLFALLMFHASSRPRPATAHLA